MYRKLLLSGQGGIIDEVRKYVHKFDYNDITALEKLFQQYKGEIAAVITEPVILEAPKNDFLNKMKTLCRQNNALLIFDEVVDGFRFSIAGKREIMDAVDKQVFISTTFGGETLSLAAGVAVMQELKNKNVTEHIWRLGKKLKENTNKLAQDIGVNIELKGYPCRMAFEYADIQGKKDWLYNSIFMQECVKRGVLLGWNVVPCYTHTDEDVEFTLNVFEDAMQVYKKAMSSNNPSSFMEGEQLKIVLG